MDLPALFLADPITPPEPVNLSALPWLLPPSAPPDTIVHPSGSAFFRLCSTWPQTSDYPSVLWHPGSTFDARQCGSASASRTITFILASLAPPSIYATLFSSPGASSSGFLSFVCSSSTSRACVSSHPHVFYCLVWFVSMSTLLLCQYHWNTTFLCCFMKVYPLIYKLSSSSSSFSSQSVTNTYNICYI